MAADDDRTEGQPEAQAETPSRLLLETMRGLSRARSPEAVAALVRHAARKLVGADGATFVLREGELCHYLDEDAIGPLWKGRRFAASACVSGFAMQHGQQVAIEDISIDARVPMEAYAPTFVRSLVMTPVRKQAPVAAIGTYWASRHVASEGELQLLQNLADAAALSLENAALVSELEQRVAARTDELLQSHKELESFAHVVAHDLRSPLSVVLGFASLIKEREAIPHLHPANEHLSEILRAGERMEAIIGALLTYSRITRATLHPQELDLSLMASTVVEKLAEKHATDKVRFSIAPGLRARVDAIQGELLLRNLLDNALKYSAKDGTAEVGLSGQTEAGVTTFCIADNGQGFDPKHADRLFLPFQRFEQQRDVAGSGVGLATCARIVRRHGGRIWATSDKGHGARFFFTLAPPPPQVQD